MEFRRRLYRRGSSFETTIPMPLLLLLDDKKNHDVVFSFDPEKQAWQVRFEERDDKDDSKGESKDDGGREHSTTGNSRIRKGKRADEEGR